VGTGAVVGDGDTPTINYIGVACSTGKIFDSSYATGKPLSYPLSQLIPGWQQGIPGMKVGGQRLLGIPPDLAYGAAGQGASIGPNETLWFVVDVLNTSAGAPAAPLTGGVGVPLGRSTFQPVAGDDDRRELADLVERQAAGMEIWENAELCILENGPTRAPGRARHSSPTRSWRRHSWRVVPHALPAGPRSGGGDARSALAEVAFSRPSADGPWRELSGPARLTHRPHRQLDADGSSAGQHRHLHGEGNEDRDPATATRPGSGGRVLTGAAGPAGRRRVCCGSPGPRYRHPQRAEVPPCRRYDRGR